ncbi:MAG: hypothetical protein Hens3KO_01980 [Henriciella sp.]
MPFRLAVLLTCLLAWPIAATAQFGPERETPRTAKEIFADRAMTDAANLTRALPQDVVSADVGIDPDQALVWYEQARIRYEELCEDRSANQDVWTRNCYKLADIYRRGLGTPQDYVRSEALYLETCQQGDYINSCLQQAYIDHKGNAGKTNWPRARSLYELACDSGDASGCAGLGNMLYRGQGGAANRSLGTALLQNACADEYQWACERLEGFGLPRRIRPF